VSPFDFCGFGVRGLRQCLSSKPSLRAELVNATESQCEGLKSLWNLALYVFPESSIETGGARSPCSARTSLFIPAMSKSAKHLYTIQRRYTRTGALMASRRFGLLDGSRLGQRFASCESHNILDIFPACHNGV